MTTFQFGSQFLELHSLSLFYLQVVRLNGTEEMLLAQLIQDVRADHLAELLAQEVHRLPVDPLGAVRLRAPLQDGNERVQRQALHDNVLATLGGNKVCYSTLNDFAGNACGKES